MGQLVGSLNIEPQSNDLLADAVSGSASPRRPSTDHEESSIDAAFIALALHNYKSQPATPAALRDSIDALENRFDFSAFVRPQAFNQAYFPATGFSQFTYSGYTNENKVIALAAEVADAACRWRASGTRTRAERWRRWSTPTRTILVYSFGTDYRRRSCRRC